HPQLASSGTHERPLSLAHRVHAQAHQDGRIRVGNGILYQSNAARGGGQVSARGERGRIAARCGRVASARTNRLFFLRLALTFLGTAEANPSVSDAVRRIPKPEAFCTPL